jgi:meso-butanediol dehydrogenase/(S,S)-butanediol dehydrogenase/diacetyl reductase
MVAGTDGLGSSSAMLERYAPSGCARHWAIDVSLVGDAVFYLGDTGCSVVLDAIRHHGAAMTDSPRTAIVTGAAAGIGRATAERLLTDGWRVVGIDRTDAAADGVDLVVGDCGDTSVLNEAVRRVRGSLHALVSSAGIPPSGPWESRDHWDEVIRVDLTAAYEAVRVCWAALVVARGSVVLVGSIVGAVEGSLRSPAYAAAKAGLEGLARSMAVIGGPDGVRVNVVAPGAIATDFDERLLPADHRTDVPIGRMGTAEEVASVIGFLVGPDATYVTGEIWTVDGGRTVLSTADASRLAQ